MCQCCAWSVNSFSRLAVFTLANGATTFYRGGSSESCKTIDISSVGVTEPGHFAHRGPPRPPDDDYPPHLSLGLSPAARSQHQPWHQQSSVRLQVAAGCRLEAAPASPRHNATKHSVRPQRTSQHLTAYHVHVANKFNLEKLHDLREPFKEKSGIFHTFFGRVRKVVF